MIGSCLCQTVRYEATQLATAIGHCHCRTCRKAHAAAFASTARVDRADFRWLHGEAALASFESSPGKLRHFCSRCGTHLMAEWLEQPQIILRVATLDDDPGVRPIVNIWTSHQVPWLHNGPDLPSLPEAAPVRE